MKIFLDTANISEIKKWLDIGLVDGITTNPSLLVKEGVNPIKQIEKIIQIIADKDVSVEVTETDPKKVYLQAKKISEIAPNIVVKIPCHIHYYPIIKRLISEKVQINVTLVFTVMQGLYMSKFGVKYISPFIGRLDDIDIDGTILLHDLRAMIDMYQFSTQILAASIRHVRHLHEAILSGANIATIPSSVLEKSITHILTDQGIENFMLDWKKIDILDFP